jgi:hypothetical protein
MTFPARRLYAVTTLGCVVLVICACGEVASTSSHFDGSVDSSGSDSGSDIDAVAVLGPWSTPARIDSLSMLGYVDHYPSVRGDGLELYFASNRDGNTQDIFVSTRVSTTKPWGAPTYVAAFEGGSTETGPDISDDGRTIWFSRAVPNTTTGFDVYTASRPSPTSSWGTSTLVTELSTVDAELSPHVSSDGLTLYFTRGASPNLDVHVATRSSKTVPWQNVKTLARFNSTANDNDVTTTGDGLEAIFESDRTGQLELFSSTRTVDGAWSVPHRITEVTGGFRADVTADGRYMVLTMIGPDGMQDLYECHR